MDITLRSQAFAANQKIPHKFTGDGSDVSPELSWLELPPGTQELALIMDDPDAPSPEPWVHWVIYKIPPEIESLAEAIEPAEKPASPAGALQGKNSWGTVGYRGPAPPPRHGIHHYYFKLYALDTTLELASGVEKADLLTAMEGHIVGEGELVGTYQR